MVPSNCLDVVEVNRRIITCGVKARVKISETVKNPNKLYFCCVHNRSYRYFSFQSPLDDEISEGAPKLEECNR